MKLSRSHVCTAARCNRLSVYNSPCVDDLYAIIYIRLIHSSTPKVAGQCFVCSIDGLLHSDNNSKIGQSSREIQCYIFSAIPVVCTGGYSTTSSKIRCSLLRDNISK